MVPGDVSARLRDRRPAARIALLGVPYDHNSSFLRGPADGPQQIREALASESGNPFSERELDVRDIAVDAGDLDGADEDGWLGHIDRGISAIAEAGLAPLALGGDHAVTFPIVETLRSHIGSFCLVHLDAHADIYEAFQGNRYSHASPFARIMEAGLVDRLVQIGVRTLTPDQRAQQQRFGVECVEMRELARWRDLRIAGPVYLSFDLDALDPAFAPGVSHWEPGGMSTRDALDIVHAFAGQLIGGDVVEYNPRRDPTGLTARVAATVTRELAAAIYG